MKKLLITCLTLALCATTAHAAQLPNPLGFTSIPQLVGRIIQAVFGVTGSIALAVFVYGGFEWLTSAGNSEKVEKGKNAMIWAALGIAVMFASYAIVSFIFSSLGRVAGIQQ